MTAREKRTKPGRGGRPDSPANVEYWRASTESVIARTQALRELHVDTARLAAAWRPVVDLARRVTARWPARLAGQVGTVTSEQAHLLASADEPRVRPCPAAAECAAADMLVRELLADAAAWPRPEPDVLARAAEHHVSAWVIQREAVRRGVDMRAGVWHRPALARPDAETTAKIRLLDLEEAERRAPPRMLRPMFTKLAEALTGTAIERALVAVLATPAPLPPPPAPQTSIEAREQYRRAAAGYKREQVAVKRRLHHRRDVALAAIADAWTRFRGVWWTTWPARVADAAADHDKTLALATRVQREALAHLESLLPDDPQPRRRRGTTPNPAPAAPVRLAPPRRRRATSTTRRDT